MTILRSAHPSLKYLALAACLLFSVSGCRESSPPEETQQPKANLQVTTVHEQDIANTLTIPGTVQADPAHVVHIYAPLSGRLVNMTLIPGQEVRKGQVVATLESGDVAQARSDFEKARIAAQLADHALARGKLLASHEVMSQADLQQLQATEDEAHSEEERARQRIHELGFSENGTSDITSITAPISGTVLDIGTASGEMQRSLETTNGIATVANLDTVWVTGDLYAQDLSDVHLHDPVKITFPAYPGQTFQGSISNIGDAMDPATHAVPVRVVLANPGHMLKPSMFADLMIARAPIHCVLLPQAAVLHENNATEVYVASSQGKYVEHPVTTGATIGDRIEILSGLSDGEQVVTQGAAFLGEPAGD